MSNEANNNDNNEFVETTETTTTTEVKPGVFGRFFNAVKNNPVKSAVALAAVAGAGYVAYDRTRNGASIEDVEEAVEVAQAALMHFA